MKHNLYRILRSPLRIKQSMLRSFMQDTLAISVTLNRAFLISEENLLQSLILYQRD